MRFPERLRFLREQILVLKGTSGRVILAGKLGVSPKTVERWESLKGKENFPTNDVLAKILELYPDKAISLNWLLAGQGEPFPGAKEEHPELSAQRSGETRAITASGPSASPEMPCDEGVLPGLGEILEITAKVTSVMDPQTLRGLYCLLQTLLTLKTRADRAAEVEKGRGALDQKFHDLSEKVIKIKTVLRKVLAEHRPPAGQDERRACMLEMERLLDEQLESPLLN